MLITFFSLLATTLILWIYILVIRKGERATSKQWKENGLDKGSYQEEPKTFRKIRISMTILASLLTLLTITWFVVGTITKKEVNKNELLPIGSVVLLEDSTKKVMIIGYCQREVGIEDKLWDYSGCLFPEGYLSADRTYLFDKEQIKTVFSMGYVNEEQSDYMEYVQDFIDKNEID